MKLGSADFLVVCGVGGLSGKFSVQLCSILWGYGICGPIGVDLMFNRRLLMDAPDALDVDRAVLMVLTCHSMKPFDVG